MKVGRESPRFPKMSRCFIWLRHAEKAYDNGKGPPGSYVHDPPLVEGQEELIKRRAQQLIAMGGYPTDVFISPYLRTRQTYEHLGVMVEPLVDANVSEYLGHQDRHRPPHLGHCTPETLSFNPPRTRESLDEFTHRCGIHLRETLGITPHAYFDDHRVIWIVTHGFVMQTIARCLMRSVCGMKRWTQLQMDPQPHSVGLLDAMILTINYAQSRLTWSPMDISGTLNGCSTDPLNPLGHTNDTTPSICDFEPPG